LATKERAVASTHHLTLSLYQGIFFTKNMTVVPFLPYFSLFLPLKIKLKERHFDTTEVMEAESKAVLSTFTEHDFQDNNNRNNSIQFNSLLLMCRVNSKTPITETAQCKY
jgi:hypothetical protein